MADPLHQSSSASVIVSVGIMLQIVTTALVLARVVARVQSGLSFYSHDWAIIISELLSFAELGIIMAATSHGYGQPQSSLPFPEVVAAMRYVFIAQVIFFWSITSVKISIAILLLSFKRERAWRHFLFFMIGLLSAALLMITALQFTACFPLPSYWDPRKLPTARCWPPQAISGVVIAFSIVQAFADVCFTVIPLTAIARLNQPLHQKVVIATLMSLGIFATVAVVFRTIVGLSWQEDAFRTSADVTLLAFVELHVAITAATLPTLKAFFERSIVRVKRLMNTAPSEAPEVVLFRMGLCDERAEETSRKLGEA